MHALKVHGPGRAHAQARRASLEWGVEAAGISLPSSGWSDELRAMIAPWAAAKSPGSFDNSAFRAMGVLLGRLHALAIDARDDLPLPVAFGRRLTALVTQLRPKLDATVSDFVAANGSRWAVSWAGERVASHRDPRPENFLKWRGELRLIDFEHARADAWAIDLAAARAAFGPLAFSALWSGYRSAAGRPPLCEEVMATALEGARVLRALQTLAWSTGREEREASARAELIELSKFGQAREPGE